MIDDFSNLEIDIFNWVKHNYNNKELISQIESAKFKKREWTKTGYFIYFEVDKNLNKIDLININSKNWPIDGPIIKSSQIEFDGGSIIWGEDGFINCIEMYSFGDFFNENVINYELSKNE